MVAKKAKKTKRATKAGKKIRNLPAKARNVKGGAYNAFVTFESTGKNQKDWLSVVQYDRFLKP